MSSMPQGDEPEQWGSQQNARPGEQTNPGTQQGTLPGQQEFRQMPAGNVPGQQGGYQGQQGQEGEQWAGQQSQQWGEQPGSGSPVSRAETKVTGRRVVQYLIDSFLVWLIPGLVSIPFDRSGSRALHIIGGIIFAALFILIGLWYWVIRPHKHNGQTFGMQMLGLRVISKDGGPANMTQLFIRWICLIFDAIPYGWPFGGIVGYIVILCSKNRQRIGDHLGRTLVISTGMRGGMGQRTQSTSGMGQRY
jgi:uncharacterized RDD family membrane protein YckC